MESGRSLFNDIERVTGCLNWRAALRLEWCSHGLPRDRGFLRRLTGIRFERYGGLEKLDIKCGPSERREDRGGSLVALERPTPGHRRYTDVNLVRERTNERIKSRVPQIMCLPSVSGRLVTQFPRQRGFACHLPLPLTRGLKLGNMRDAVANRSGWFAVLRQPAGRGKPVKLHVYHSGTSKFRGVSALHQPFYLPML